MNVSFKVYVSFQIQINIINSNLTISAVIFLGLTKLKLKMSMRRVVWPGGSALGRKEEKNIGERSELGGSLGPFLLPSPLFSLPRSPIYFFYCFSQFFVFFLHCGAQYQATYCCWEDAALFLVNTVSCVQDKTPANDLWKRNWLRLFKSCIALSTG